MSLEGLPSSVLVKGKEKVFHANMLKRYVRREEAADVAVGGSRYVQSVGDFVPWREISPLLDEVAFDRVNRDKLLRVLEQYGVMGQLLDNIRAIYANSRSAVHTSSGTSDWFPVTSGL